jgi:putative transposase
LEDIEAWQKRSLETRYPVIYLDGQYCKLKRQSVDSGVIYLAIEIIEHEYRQVLGFYIGGHESANGWREIH